MSPAPISARIRSALQPYLRLPVSIYIIFTATIINGIGIFVFPFMTLILTRNLGYDPKTAGIIMMLLSTAYIPGGFIGGKLADRFGRKKVMMVTQLVSVAAFVPCGFLGNSPLIVLFIAISIFFDGITDPARQAMQTDLTTPENRQTAFSLIYLGHNLGFALGPLIAGFLFNRAPQWIFWGNALAAGIAVLLVLAFVPETKPTNEQLEQSLHSDSSEKAVQGGLIKALLSRPFLLLYVFITTWYGFVYAQHRFLLPLQTDQLFGAGGAPLYGLLMTFNAVIVVVFNIPLVAALKRFGPVVNTAIAGFLYALGFGMLGLIHSKWLFFVSVFIWTAGEIVNATNSEVYVANHTPMSHRGRFNAVIPLIWGFGWGVSTWYSGMLTEAFGLNTTWLLMGLIAASAALGVLLLNSVEQRRKKRRADLTAAAITPEA